MPAWCAVKGCHSNSKFLQTWSNTYCFLCEGLRSTSDPDVKSQCVCLPPYRLFPFPTKIKDPVARQKWKQLINRVEDKSKLWSPSKNSKVCSHHFVLGEPSCKHPYPEINLGYSESQNRVRRILFADCTTAKRRKTSHASTTYKVFQESTQFADPPIHSLTTTSFFPVYFESLVSILLLLYTFIVFAVDAIRQKINLEKKLKQLKTLLAKEKQNLTKLNLHIKKLSINNERQLSKKLLKDDKTVLFYTGVASKDLFFELLLLVKPFIKRRWTGTASFKEGILHQRRRQGRKPLLTASDELLLTLMKLRLGLLTKDIAARFQISVGLCSQIFFNWLRALSLVLSSMIFIPDMDQIRASKPLRFRNLPDLHSIIDCTEIFIETPKDLFLQNATWSQYKHHNTLKVLIAIAPNGTITFVSKAYTGRISDKELTLKSGFLNLLPPYCQIMADKGFNIQDECALNSISLHIPPGRRGQSQMTSACVIKTKRIANLRILVEQVIRELKTFRIIQQQLPITLIPHVDDILTVCSALVNFKKPMY